MIIFDNFTDFKAAVGQDLGYTDYITVTQEMIDNFAKATLDFQWIHLDSERAKQTPFGGTIAHGFLTLSLLSKFSADLYTVKNVKMGVNYGLNKVRFTGIVPSGAKVRMKAHVLNVEDFPKNGLKATLEVVLEIENSPKPVCVAEWMFLMFE
jgi:acyl dehydratase